MTEHHIRLKHTDWTDRVFRVMRRLAGLELYLHVLISDLEPVNVRLVAT